MITIDLTQYTEVNYKHVNIRWANCTQAQPIISTPLPGIMFKGRFNCVDYTTIFQYTEKIEELELSHYLNFPKFLCRQKR